MQRSNTVVTLLLLHLFCGRAKWDLRRLFFFRLFLGGNGFENILNLRELSRRQVLEVERRPDILPPQRKLHVLVSSATALKNRQPALHASRGGSLHCAPTTTASCSRTTMLSATLRSNNRVLRRSAHYSLLSRRPRPSAVVCYYVSTEKEKNEKDSLRDTIHRLKGENSTSSSSSNTRNDEQVSDLMRKAADLWEKVKSEVSITWQELVNAGKPKSVNKKILPTETEEGNQEYTGPVEIMVIDESEHLTAWERMQRRLTEAPIIQGAH